MKLLIVESPAKAKKIQHYLGAGWQVKACMGHVRDLPANKDDLPAKYKDVPWARLGIDVDNDYAPLYVTRQDKHALIKGLKAAASSAEQVYLAADPDREGESIAWHLSVLLGLGKNAQRVTYQEITERAIRQAVQHPRALDYHLIAAQETRRLLDRLAGYGVSPLLWSAIGGPQSAGRVQSAALMLLAQREQARLNFVPAGFWRVTAKVGAQVAFRALVTAYQGVPLATASSFTPQGQLKPDLNVVQLDAEKAEKLSAYLSKQQAVVRQVNVTPVVRRPPPPLTTSGLQQAANAKLKLGAAQVTKLAQGLYEGGFITYIRTDSPHLSSEAIQLSREAVATRFGLEALPTEGRQYTSKSQNAQEAHEAIRPAGTFQPPAQTGLSGEELAVYQLIYDRTLASQMKDAVGENTSVTLQAGVVTLLASGTRLTEKGFTALYDDGEPAEDEQTLPQLEVGAAYPLSDVKAEAKKSSPPGRYSEGKFVQMMEKAGIGRPSTYGATLATLAARQYTAVRNRQLHVTPLGLMVAAYLLKEVPQLVNAKFTAQMEHDLDQIAEGKLSRVAYLDQIWKAQLQPAIQRADTAAPRLKAPGLDAVYEVRGGEVRLHVGDDFLPLAQGLLPEDLTPTVMQALANGSYQSKAAQAPKAPKATRSKTPRSKTTKTSKTTTKRQAK